MLLNATEMKPKSHSSRIHFGLVSLCIGLFECYPIIMTFIIARFCSFYNRFLSGISRPFPYLEVRCTTAGFFCTLTIHDLPSPEKFQCRSGTKPVFYHVCCPYCIGAGLRHISKADIIALIHTHDGYRHILNRDKCCFLRLAYTFPTTSP